MWNIRHYLLFLNKATQEQTSIPNGTSELERIFSVIKAMKTKKRSKLKTSKLEKLLSIFYFLDLENYDLNEVHQIFTELMR